MLSSANLLHQSSNQDFNSPSSPPRTTRPHAVGLFFEVRLEILGISQASLSEIESGKSKPMLDTLITLGSNYQVDMNWLLNNIGADILATFQDNEINLIKNYRLLELIAQEEVADYLGLKLKRFTKKM
jgi:DNA-binding XRE family transcriptional regulator